jgi:SNF family Na+-dependent transporter
MNTSPPSLVTDLSPTTNPSMFDSRKFKAAVLAVVLIGVLVVGMVVLVAMGKATVDQLTSTWQTAIGSLAVIISVLIGAIAHEDGKAKSVQPQAVASTVNNITSQPAPPAVVQPLPPPLPGSGSPRGM